MKIIGTLFKKKSSLLLFLFFASFINGDSYKYNAYKKFSYKFLPMVEKVSRQCLSLPIYPELPLKYVKFIGKVLDNYE